MAVLTTRSLGSNYFCFDRKEAAKAGALYKDKFVNASPYPHLVIDDFFDRALLDRVVNEFPTRPPGQIVETDNQHLKLNFKPEDIESGFIRNLLSELTQLAMIEFIRASTGLDHLIPDPYFVGAGLHETRPGGNLVIHGDFTLSREMRAQRRVNLIVFLNDDWHEEYGGHLELWDRDAQACAHRILPIMGRAVIFQTDPDAYHGHPQPLACPQGRTRRSIAVYYYTAPEKGIASLPPGSANYIGTKRPGPLAVFRKDWRRIVTNAAIDATPPIVYRAARRLAGKG